MNYENFVFLQINVYISKIIQAINQLKYFAQIILFYIYFFK